MAKRTQAEAFGSARMPAPVPRPQELPRPSPSSAIGTEAFRIQWGPPPHDQTLPSADAPRSCRMRRSCWMAPSPTSARPSVDGPGVDPDAAADVDAHAALEPSERKEEELVHTQEALGATMVEKEALEVKVQELVKEMCRQMF